MRPKSILLLVLALGCGLVASIGISQVMENRAGQQGAPAVEMDKIFVAMSDVNVNEPLTEELLRLEEWPKDKIPHDAIRELEEVQGRRVRTKLYKDEPIRESRLISAEGESAANTIPRGYRPVPVRVDVATGAAGLVKPGDRVDVLLYVKKNGTTIDRTQTKTILQDVKVFAVDQDFRRAADEEDAAVVARTISLLLTPRQGNKISLATKLGEISLLLRHPDDKSLVKDADVSEEDLLNPEKSNREKERASVAQDDESPDGMTNFLDHLKTSSPQAQAVRIAQPWKMVVLRGSDAEELEFPVAGGLPTSHSGPSPGAYAPAVPGDSDPEPKPQEAGSEESKEGSAEGSDLDLSDFDDLTGRNQDD